MAISIATGVKDIAIFDCYSEDTRLLTDQGFLFVDQVAARLDSLRFACYNPATAQLEYHPALTFICKPRDRHRMVNFTHQAQQRQHALDSRSAQDDNTERRNNHVSLLVTAGHDMYVQRGEQSASGSIGWHRRTGYGKVEAGELLTAEKSACICLLSSAAAGVHVEQTQPTSLPFAGALGLRTTAQVDAFLELYGFWLGDGRMSYQHEGSGNNAVRFSQKRATDGAFLSAKLEAVGLDSSQLRVCESGESDEMLEVVDERWFAYFDEQHGSTYPGDSSRSVAKVTAVAIDEELQDARVHVHEASLSARGAADDDGIVSKSVNGSVASPSRRCSSHCCQSHHPTPPLCCSCRFLPWVLDRLNRDQLRLLLGGFRRAVAVCSQDEEQVLYTSSVLVRDQLEVALLHAGYTAYFELAYRKGVVRGYTDHTQGEGSTTLSVAQYEHRSAAQQKRCRPIVAQSDTWAVIYADASNETGRAASRPTLHCSTDVTSDTDYVGRVWCVQVPHGLVVAQRAVVDEDGRITRVSRPVVCGNCRPKMNAQANRLAGKGFESSENYRNCKIFFMNIENIHAMRTSYQKLIKACMQDVHSYDFAQAVHASGWLSHVSMVLKATYQMVLSIDRDRLSILSQSAAATAHRPHPATRRTSPSNRSLHRSLLCSWRCALLRLRVRFLPLSAVRTVGTARLSWCR